MAPLFYPPLDTGSSGGGVSLRGYLMMLIAAILLPMLGLVGLITWDYGHAARRTIEAERLDVANNIKIMIDREIDHTEGFLDGISSSPGLRANTPEIVARMADMARQRGFSALTLYDLDGRTLMTAPGSAPLLGADKVGLAAIKAGERHAVSGLLDVGDRVGDGPGLYFVSVPVRADGQIVALLAAGLPPQRLQRLLAEAGLRDGWTASIVDRNGLLLARSRGAETYIGLPAQQPLADVARGTAAAGLFDELNRSGVSIKSAFERSAASGWVVGVGVPTEIVEAPLHHTALLMGIIGIALTLASLVMAFMVASHLSRAIRRLGLAAVAIASGDAVRMPASNITELRDVSRSMEVTGALARLDRRRQP